MLFGLKNTSSCAHAALNLSILLSMSFHVLYELVKQTRKIGIIEIQFVCIQIVS